MSNKKKKKCQNCNKTLSYNGFINQNSSVAPKFLEQLWDYPKVELYCCSCYPTFFRQHKINNKTTEFGNLVLNLINKSETIYPHQIIRYCANCNEPTFFENFYDFSRNLSFRTVLKIWVNESTKIYCDLCYDPPEAGIYCLDNVITDYNSLIKIETCLNAKYGLSSVFGNENSKHIIDYKGKFKLGTLSFGISITTTTSLIFFTFCLY